MTEGDVSNVPMEPRGFRVHIQKTLPFSARDGLAAWSPKLDLIAVVTENEHVLLYRMNGQRVWGFAHKVESDARVEKLNWRPDGKMLALGYADGSTRIYDVNNGKAIHRIVSEVAGFGKSKSVECTPQALFDLDIGSMMPRLSVLTSSAGPNSTFTSKTTLDALINGVTNGGEGGRLDVLIIGEDGGKMLLNVFDSFLIGTMDLSSLCHQLKVGSKLLRHTASSDLLTHALLMSEPAPDRLVFSTMDVLFIQQFGQYLFQLASTSTRVQALIRYMRETVTSLEAGFASMNDFTQKYVRIIDEDAQKIDSNVGLELFEFLVTGGPSPPLKEWLSDTLTDRGAKQWEKNSTSAYEGLRRLVHENLLPTCERLTVLFCRLRGLARWKESGSPLGLEPDDFTRCLEVVSAITLYGHEFLQKVGNELDLFKCFCKWLHSSIDQLVATVTVDEKAPEDPQVDTLKIAEYVGTHLRESSLLQFFKKDTMPRLSEYKAWGENITELYAHKEKSAKAPGFMELAEYLDKLCATVFSKPQQSMRQQLRISRPVVISEQNVRKVDMRMAKGDEGHTSAHILVCGGGAFLAVICCHINVDGGLSTGSKIGCANVSIPQHHELVDMKFVDEALGVLILRDTETETSELMTFDYSALRYDEGFISESAESVYAYAGRLAPQPIVAVSRRSYRDSFVPAQVMVNGAKDRRVGCLIAEDKIRYIVFDLDHDEDEAADDESMDLDP